MPINHKFETTRGVPACYWIVTAILTDHRRKMVQAEVVGFYNKATALAKPPSNEPLDTVAVRFHGADYEELTACGKQWPTGEQVEKAMLAKSWKEGKWEKVG